MNETGKEPSNCAETVPLKIIVLDRFENPYGPFDDLNKAAAFAKRVDGGDVRLVWPPETYSPKG